MGPGCALVLALLLCAWPVGAHAQLPPPGPPAPDQTRLREIYKELLLLAHLDVVEAKREDWERDPFKLVSVGPSRPSPSSGSATGATACSAR